VEFSEDFDGWEFYSASFCLHEINDKAVEDWAEILDDELAMYTPATYVMIGLLDKNPENKDTFWGVGLQYETWSSGIIATRDTEQDEDEYQTYYYDADIANDSEMDAKPSFLDMDPTSDL